MRIQRRFARVAMARGAAGLPGRYRRAGERLCFTYTYSCAHAYMQAYTDSYVHIHPQTHTHPPLVEFAHMSLFCRYDNQTLRIPTLSCAAILTQMQRVVRGGLARRLSKRRRIHNRRLQSAPGRFFVAPASNSVTSCSLRFSSALYLSHMTLQTT